VFEVALHLGEQVADEGLEVGKTRTLVGGDDEAELVRILLGPVQERGAIRVIRVGIVEPAGGAFARDPVANDVLDVRPRRAQVAGDNARVARLDDDAPAPGGDETGGGPRTGAHAALGGGRGDVAALPQYAGATLSGLPEHESRMALCSGAPRIADASEPWIDLVLGHRPSLDLPCAETRYGERGGVQDGGNQWSDLAGEFLPLTVCSFRKRHRRRCASRLGGRLTPFPLS